MHTKVNPLVVLLWNFSLCGVISVMVFVKQKHISALLNSTYHYVITATFRWNFSIARFIEVISLKMVNGRKLVAN